MSDLLTVERPREAVALLTLNRPDKKNALSVELRDECSDALDALAADESVKTVVVTGAGDVFSAGFDLREFESAMEDPQFDEVLWASSDRFHRTWLSFPLPTVAAVNGAAIAGGFDVAVMCDLRVAAETATFSHPELAFGDVVYGPLHDLVGAAVAKDWCLSGRAVPAEEALARGFVTAVVPAGQVVDDALALAESVARGPREVLVRTKAKMIRRADVVSDRTLDL